MRGAYERGVSRIEVDGFRSLKSIALDLGRITVLIGPNGAGKSNLLTALQMVPQIWTRNLQRFVQRQGGARALLHYGPEITPTMRIRMGFRREGGDDAYEVRLARGAGDQLTLENAYVSFHAPETAKQCVRVETDTTLKILAWWFEQLNFFHFPGTLSTSAIRWNAVGAEPHPQTEGPNLAAFLLRLKASTAPDARASWARIEGIIRHIAPSVRELNPVGTTPTNTHPHDLPATYAPPDHVRLDWTDDQGETFGEADLSAGTLRAIALVSVLAQPARTLPGFISIDEPELGLHPSALALFAGLVRSVSTRCQVLLSTQSSALLDHFQPEEVVVVERVDGASTFRRLDPAALAGWLEDYTLSELYDKNVLGGRP